MLDIKNLTKTYGDKKAVDNLTSRHSAGRNMRIYSTTKPARQQILKSVAAYCSLMGRNHNRRQVRKKQSRLNVRGRLHIFRIILIFDEFGDRNTVSELYRGCTGINETEPERIENTRAAFELC